MKHLPLIIFVYCTLMLPSAFGQICANVTGIVKPFPGNGYQVIATYNPAFLGTVPFNAIVDRPYSAEETITQTLILPDGKKDERSLPSNFHYRDSAGRTRTESSINMPVLFISPEITDIPIITEIFDPVAGYCYYLNSHNRTAYRVALPKPAITDAPLLESIISPLVQDDSSNAASEITMKFLGTKTIAGVEAIGFQTKSRYVFGDQQITTETEIWTYPKLIITMSSASRTLDSSNNHEIISEKTIVDLKQSEPIGYFFRIPDGYTIIDEKLPFTISFPPVISISPLGLLQSLFDYAAIRELLKSQDSKEQAWGAWLAGEGQMSEVIPLLEEVVTKRLKGDDWLEDYLPSQAALDSLIKLRSPVSAKLLSEMYSKWPIQALILMSNRNQFTELAPDDAAFILDLAAKETGYRWFAAANLLLRHRVAGTAAFLLRDMEVNANLCVISEKDGIWYPCAVGGIGGFSGGDGGSGNAEGYPTFTHYYLTGANSGNTLLANGPTPIYYASVVSRPGTTSGGAIHEIGGPNTKDKFQYLESLLNRPGTTLPLQAAEYREFRPGEQKSLESEISDFKADILKRYEILLQVLIQANLLTEEEKVALPSLKINMQVNHPQEPIR